MLEWHDEHDADQSGDTWRGSYSYIWCCCLPRGCAVAVLISGLCCTQHLIDAVTSDAFGDELPLGIISLDGDSIYRSCACVPLIFVAE